MNSSAFRDEHLLDAIKRFPELQGRLTHSPQPNVKAMPSTMPTPRGCFWRKSKRSCSSV
jgi:hypothetical protein